MFISFDIPVKKVSLRKQINRALHSIRAEMIQKSLWRSGSLDRLREIANLILNQGGKALLIKEEVIPPYLSPLFWLC